MSNKPNDGGPAFARAAGPEPRVNEFHEYQDGLSKRELFAAMAMQGMFSAMSREADWPPPENVAPLAVGFADALLAELAKKG